jgi:class 3 adenylate cyclase
MWGEPPLGTPVDGRSRFHLPAGTVTFLLSDIEGSTRLWSDFPDAMSRAVADTCAILDRAIVDHDGVRPVEQGSWTKGARGLIFGYATRDERTIDDGVGVEARLSGGRRSS